MQVDSARSMDQMRIPGILRLDKTSRSSGFTATPQTLAAMQVFHFTKNLILLRFSFCLLLPSVIYCHQKQAMYFQRFFSLTLLELIFEFIFEALLNFLNLKEDIEI